MEVDNIAVLVSEDLNFDVLSSLNVAFEKNCGVSEGVLGFFLGLGKACLKLGWFFNDSHTTTSSTKCGLNDERETDLMSDCEGLIGIGNGVIGARKNWHFGCDRLCASSSFVTHGAKEVGGWSNKGNAFAFAGAGEIGIFGEESISGMNESDAF